MLKKLSIAVLAAAFLMAAGSGASAQLKVDPRLPAYKSVSGVSGNLKSIGSDTLNNLMTLWAEGFKAQYPDVKIEIEGKGSSTAPPALIARVDSIQDDRRRTYGAMVTSLDDGVGQVVSLLGELGLTDGTLVFFLSDNGGPTRANASDNFPLRSTKGTVYEGGVRVPFVVSWPGHLAAGTVYEPMVSSLDIFPTAVAAAGLELPAGLDGVDLMPHLNGERSGVPHESLFWHSDEGDQLAVRTGDRKLVRSLDREPELYAIDADASEANDISGDDSVLTGELERSAGSWHAAHPPPAWPGTRSDRPIHPNTAAALRASPDEVQAWVARRTP